MGDSKGKSRSNIPLSEELKRTLGAPSGDGRDYSDSPLSDWLAYEKWDEKEAMCLLCDIDPTGAKISWSGFYNYDDVHIELPKITNVGLLSKSDAFYVIPYKSPNDPALPAALRPKSNDQSEVNSAIERKRKTLMQVEGKLQKVWIELTRRSPEIDSSFGASYPPYIWVDWANRHDISVPWLEWAENLELVRRPNTSNSEKEVQTNKGGASIDSDTPPKQPSLEAIHRKKVKTLLNIIAGLLGIILGKTSYGKKNSIFHTQSDVINALLETYPNKQGIKKRTLEEKFKEAKSSIED